jgi:hypothetical protein
MTKLNEAIAVWNEGPKLNKNNYHMSTGYLSNSFIKAFQECEYSSIINYAFKEDETSNPVFITGHLVEAYVFGGYTGWHNMITTIGQPCHQKNGKPYKWVEDSMVFGKAIIKHENLKNLLRTCDSIYHKVITFELHGRQWCGELDYLNINKETEIDLKTTASDFYNHAYNPISRKRDLTFIDEYNYHLQRALYQEGIRQEYGITNTPRIIAVSKKTKSVKLFKFDDQERLNLELIKLVPIVERFEKVLGGIVPNKCHICPQCVAAETVEMETLTSTYCCEVV